MADNTLTLALEGEVSLASFQQALLHLHRLVTQLTQEAADRAVIEWLVDDLQGGSAHATFIGVASEPESVRSVIRAYEQVGSALQQHEPIPFSPAVASEAHAISRLISDKIIEIRFETAETEYSIGEFAPNQPQGAFPVTSFGTLKGRVQTISSRGNLKFTLYDAIFDKPVTCYIADGRESQMKDIWGKMVLVTGRVTRDPERGRPLRVRDIRAIDEVTAVSHPDFRAARGIFHWQPGDEPAEVIIRHLRDDED